MITLEAKLRRLPSKTVVVRKQDNETLVVMEQDVEVVSVGDDPYGRGEPTVYYRDWNCDEGRDIHYLWKELWSQHYPHVKLPEDKK